jgi:hypothetical protein
LLKKSPNNEINLKTKAKIIHDLKAPTREGGETFTTKLSGEQQSEQKAEKRRERKATKNPWL